MVRWIFTGKLPAFIVFENRIVLRERVSTAHKITDKKIGYNYSFIKYENPFVEKKSGRTDKKKSG